MSERRWLYFVLGVTTVISVGAVTNQLVPRASSGIALSDQGVHFPDGTVQTTAAVGNQGRVFFLTADDYGGDGAALPATCGAGFHMASMWEILDVSNVRYATDQEAPVAVERRGDTGSGPPSGLDGWIRTGYASAALEEGKANCLLWTSSESTEQGTLASLEELWASPTGTGNPSVVVAPWDSTFGLCGDAHRVWCVQD